jgi:two-component system cell cycle sensor histidine kinase/response regulator CckA
LQGACVASIAVASIGLGCMWLAYPHGVALLALCTVAFNALTGGILLLTRRGRVPDRLLSAAGSVLFIGLSSLQLCAFITARSELFAVFVALHLLAGGALQTTLRWMLAGTVYTLASFLVAGFALIGPGFTMAATAMIMAAVTALTVHLLTMRHLREVAATRRRERRHRAELADALAAAERELVDRQRAEAERERLREQLLHAQKLKAVGTLAGGVAHDMNNVLAAIGGLAELLREEASGPVSDGLGQILEAARRGTELTRNLLGFSRRGKYRKEHIEVLAVVASVTRLLSHTLPKGIEVGGSNAAARAVEGDSAQLGQALLNLCLNSVDAMSGSGRLRIDTGEAALAGDAARALGLADGSYVTVAVADDGCGMDRETQARMFEPFFTTKELGRGSGLGLAMVYGTIANHGGAIAVDSEPGRGTTITLYLPAVERPAPPAPAPKAAVSRTAGDGALILVVDDEPMVRTVTRRSLERGGYRVVTASDGAEALERYAEHADSVEVVVLDMAMPVMGGAECFRRLRERAPDVRVLFASGYALEQEARDCLAAGALGFLEKPFAAARLLDAVAFARAGKRLDGHSSWSPSSCVE